MRLLNYADEEYTVAGATTAAEATKLLEAGFQYATTIERIQLFKKRKWPYSLYTPQDLYCVTEEMNAIGSTLRIIHGEMPKMPH